MNIKELREQYSVMVNNWLNDADSNKVFIGYPLQISIVKEPYELYQVLDYADRLIISANKETVCNYMVENLIPINYQYFSTISKFRIPAIIKP